MSQTRAKDRRASCRDFSSLPTYLVIELVPSTPTMRVPLPMRLPDVYDLLQILLEVTSSQEFGFLWCRVQSIQSSSGMIYLGMLHAPCLRYHRPRPVSTSSTSTTLVQSWRNDANSPITTLAWLRIRDVVQPTFYLLLHSSGMNVFKPGEWWGKQKV